MQATIGGVVWLEKAIKGNQASQETIEICITDHSSMSLDTLLSKVASFCKTVASIRHVSKTEGRFDIDHFRGMTRGPQTLILKCFLLSDYAGRYLQRLGEGSGRDVFLYSPKKVLKIAKNGFGLAQNEEEREAALHPTGYLVVPKLYQTGYDQEGKPIWILMELIRNVKSDSEFRSLTGMAFDYFIGELRTLLKLNESADKTLLHKELGQENKFMHDIFRLIADRKIFMTDVSNFHHWGVNSDQKVVLMDPGYTEYSDQF